MKGIEFVKKALLQGEQTLVAAVEPLFPGYEALLRGEEAFRLPDEALLHGDEVHFLAYEVRRLADEALKRGSEDLLRQVEAFRLEEQRLLLGEQLLLRGSERLRRGLSVRRSMECYPPGNGELLPMAIPETSYEHIVLSNAGVPMIARTSTKVHQLVLDKMAYGWSPEELQFQHPHLTPSISITMCRGR